MSAAFLALVQSLAYAIAKGVAEAWFEVQAKQSTAVLEKHDATDDARVDAARTAVAGMRDVPPSGAAHHP